MTPNERTGGPGFQREVPRDVRGEKPRLFRRVLETSQGPARSTWGMDQRVLTVRVGGSRGTNEGDHADPDGAHPIIVETSARGQLLLITLTRSQAMELAEALLDAVQRTPVDVTPAPAPIDLVIDE